MVWHLLFAHFLADFPLQPGWIVQNKVRFWVLLLHVTIHFAAMAVVFLPATARLWPYLLALAAVHFFIDTIKNWFTVHYPHWRIWPYLIDQLVHYLTIGLVSIWIANPQPAASLWLPTQAAVIGIGFLLVTFVYMITERIILSERPTDSPVTHGQVWGRLAWRASLFGLLLLGSKFRDLTSGGAALILPYPAGQVGRRIFFQDLLVTLSTALLVIIINRQGL